MAEETFTHFDETGRVQMVDVSAKPDTKRTAVGRSVVLMKSSTRQRIENREVSKGDVLAIAELAGVMGAKRTADLIPLCHPLSLSHVSVRCEWGPDIGEDFAQLLITSTVQVTGQTGVEMEALTACSTAALTVYDMCKAVDRDMVIQDIRLLRKAGGRSGTYEAPNSVL